VFNFSNGAGVNETWDSNSSDSSLVDDFEIRVRNGVVMPYVSIETDFYKNGDRYVPFERKIELDGDSIELYLEDISSDWGMGSPDLIYNSTTYALREDSPGLADVPSPHAATILALGIMGLSTRRFKKQS
jgi:hypothetical protein